MIQLRARAAKARELANHVADRQAEANLLSYAADLEREADALEKPEKERPGGGQGQS